MQYLKFTVKHIQQSCISKYTNVKYRQMTKNKSSKLNVLSQYIAIGSTRKGMYMQLHAPICVESVSTKAMVVMGYMA